MPTLLQITSKHVHSLITYKYRDTSSNLNNYKHIAQEYKDLKCILYKLDKFYIKLQLASKQFNKYRVVSVIIQKSRLNGKKDKIFFVCDIEPINVSLWITARIIVKNKLGSLSLY